MEQYKLSIILDKSEKPKLTGVSGTFISVWILMCIIACIITGAFIKNEAVNIICFMAAFVVIPYWLISDAIFNKKHKIVGTCTLEPFNGKEVAVFKSSFNEIAILDFENIITNGGSVSTITGDDNKLHSIQVTNTNTDVVFNGTITKCAIKLMINDKHLLRYIIANGWVKGKYRVQ